MNEGVVAEFNIRDVVIKVLDTTSLVDPAVIAVAVLNEIPATELQRVVAQLLPTYVREVNRQCRNNPVSKAEHARQSARSPKMEGFRAIGRAWLRSRIQVADGWKILGDCGYDDLMFAAEERRRLAAENIAKANEYQAYAERIRVCGVACLADLPASELDGLEDAA